MPSSLSNAVVLSVFQLNSLSQNLQTLPNHITELWRNVMIFKEILITTKSTLVLSLTFYHILFSPKYLRSKRLYASVYLIFCLPIIFSKLEYEFQGRTEPRLPCTAAAFTPRTACARRFTALLQCINGEYTEGARHQLTNVHTI